MGLTNATFSYLPIYYMSLLMVPMAVKDELDHIRRNLLWERSSDKWKLHLMKCDEVIKPKYVEDLDLVAFKLKFWAMMAKRWWRFVVKRET